jgi:DNA end-binding protein Ku
MLRRFLGCVWRGSRDDQPVHRQANDKIAGDLEDRYETRLRAINDAKLKGEGVDASEPEEPARTNVVDLMAALKKSLSQAEEEKKPSPAKKPAAKVMPIKLPQAATRRKRA